MAAAIGPINYHADWGPCPAVDGFAITPSDSTNFNSMARKIYIGGNGNVAVVFPTGNVVTFVSCLVGTILEVTAIRVNATNTTATNLVGLI